MESHVSRWKRVGWHRRIMEDSLLLPPPMGGSNARFEWKELRCVDPGPLVIALSKEPDVLNITGWDDAPGDP